MLHIIRVKFTILKIQLDYMSIKLIMSRIDFTDVKHFYQISICIGKNSLNMHREISIKF
jgi:hypothetical protein